MTEYYHCFNCKKVTPLFGNTEKKCPSCGGASGEALSQERFAEGLKAGTFFNSDPATGKRTKYYR